MLAKTLVVFWWLHASENPSSILMAIHASENPISILCVVSGHLVLSFYQNLFSGIAYSIMSNKTLPYHTINMKLQQSSESYNLVIFTNIHADHVLNKYQVTTVKLPQ